MKKGTLAALLVALVILSTGSFAVASASPNEKAREGASKARDVLEGIPVDLPDIDAITFIFYAKPPGTPGKGPGAAKGEEGGYVLLRGGVKWADKDLPVKYSINANGYGGGFDAVVAAFETWDAEVAKELYDNAVETTDRSGILRDDNNTVSWAFIEDNNIIAQCTIWFYVNTKEIIEFDIVFSTQQPWGIDPDGEETSYVLTNAFDIQNIATHEAGHTLHLGDLYESEYSEMTMYGYAGIGEVKKRSLEWGDKNGVHKLYGA
jgi:hypothetical protein